MPNNGGFSQLLVITGSVLMLLGLLAVSTLVTKNQDNRNKASYATCSQVMSNYCSQVSKKCVPDINGGHCEILAPTPTIIGSCNSPGYHCKNGDSYFCHSEGTILVDSLSGACGVRGCLNGYCVGPTPIPSNEPIVTNTPAPTSMILPTGKIGCSPIGNHCVGGDVFSCHVEGTNSVDEFYEDCGIYTCYLGKCIIPVPSSRPTEVPLPTGKIGCSPIGNHCVGGDVFSCHMEGLNTIDEFYEDCGTKSCSRGKCVVPTTFSTLNDCLKSCSAGHACFYAGRGIFTCN